MDGNVGTQLRGKQSVYEESSTRLVPLGTKLELAERIFRYALNGTGTLAPGKLVVQPDNVVLHVGRAIAAAAKGALKVTVTLGATAATANQYRDGYLVINTEGTMYRIKSHPAAALSTAVELTLYDGLAVALAGDETVDLVPNVFSELIISDANQNDRAMGWPIIAVTASYYFWLQTAGPVPTLIDETLATRGIAVTTGSHVGGAVEMADAAGEPVIGTTISFGVDAAYKLIYAQLE